MSDNIPFARLEQSSIPGEDISIVSLKAVQLLIIACIAPVRAVHLVGHNDLTLEPLLDSCFFCTFSRMTSLFDGM